MAYTQAEVDRLKSQAAKGITRGRIGGEEVQFDTLAAMRRQIARMEAEIAVAAGTRSGGMTLSYPKTSRGLGS